MDYSSVLKSIGDTWAGCSRGWLLFGGVVNRGFTVAHYACIFFCKV